VLDDQSHALTVRIEWELTQDLVILDGARKLVANFDELLGSLLEHEATLLGTLDESQLVGTGCLIGHLASAGVLVYDHSVADGKQSEEVIKVMAGTSILNALAHLTLHNIH